MVFDHTRRLAVGLAALLFAVSAQAQVRITEWMYSGAGGEFVELTNAGSEPVDLTGWRYDDDSASFAEGFDLGGFGVVQPGESVVLTESDAEAFRSEWSLCTGVQILGGYTNGLGRGDQINIFDASAVIVDRLTYGDEVFPGSIRTQGASGWVSAAGLGADDIFEWTLSSVGDAEGSLASIGGAIGSPGRSLRATVAYDPCTPTGPAPVALLAQDWTDIGQITADDNWTGVAGIVGYRGDGLAGGTAVDPQTILADGSATPIDVIANQTNPNTLTAGGLAEFQLTDPVVAFQGSGTARAPHLVLTVDTTDLGEIAVSYILRDIDGGNDNSVQPVALQYRVGSSGSYINLPAGFVADASSGPGLATLVTPVDVVLPADADNQPVVQIRILTADAVGSDEWIGVDDILVTGIAPQANTPPTVDAGGPYTTGVDGTITLNGTVIDPDTGDTLDALWSVAPAGPTFTDPTAVDAELNGNGAVAGDYVLTLTVDDGSGPVSDTAQLTIAQGQPPGAAIRITEWMYSGAGGEFIELTNAGTEPVDLTGWRYDDDSASFAEGFDLSGFGVVQPGESVVLAENDAEAFRSEWSLCTGVRILGGYTNNLGRADQINVFDASAVIVDRLTYGDEVFPGSIRTQGASGWVSAAGLGADDIFEWTLSSVGDAEGSLASIGGAIGSPGRSLRAAVAYDPCGGSPGPDILASTIATGSQFACGLDVSGFAYCWGSDSAGQLGNGPAVTANFVSPYPVDMTSLPGGTRFESIVAGGSSACALATDGLAYCWGQDSFGQLGNGPGITGNQPLPVAVDMSALNGALFESLAAGTSHLCGVDDLGVAYCWGRSGPLGLPPDVTDDQASPSPVDMALLPPGAQFVLLDAASGHTCGQLLDGSLYCWGQNGSGQLGIGSLGGGTFPITAVDTSGLPAGTQFVQVTTGDSHSCALSIDDVAYCWGANIVGAIGSGATGAPVPVPNPVVTSTIPAGSRFVFLEGGSTNTCGILDTGAAYCWGFGSFGALGTGDGTTQPSPQPVDTTNLAAGTAFTELSASNNLTCAATQAGEFYCWGRDDQGQQGNGPLLTADPSLSPTLVFPFVPVEGLPPTISLADPVVIGSVGDPTNVQTTLTIADPDTAIADLVIEVSTANGSIITPAGVTVTGDGSERVVSFAPIGRGLSNVTFIVTDPQGNGQSATLQYASSNQAPDPSGRYHHRISDASAALGVGDGHVILLNDETNTIFLHREDVTGAPVKTWEFTSAQLGTGSEIDFEGITRSGDLLLISGSHGNSRNGPARPERRTFVAATITGAGAETELVFLGRYNGLWSELRTWDQTDGHGLGANALGFIAGTEPGVLPNPPLGFNIESIEFSPEGDSVYLAFRAPTIDIDGVQHALIVPLLNVEDIINGTPGTGPAQFGAPILVDLAGRSIRALASNGQGGYLISAGPSPQNPTWALYTWDGNPDSAPQFNRDLPSEDLLTGGTWESIGTVPGTLEEGALVRLITDSGDTNFYGTGATKDLQPVYQKSYSQAFTLEAVPGGGDQGGMRITEWMYSGADGEFIELTNVGTDPVDLAGWRYDDDSASPVEGFDLSGFGVVQPGESVVLAENEAEAFRGAWNLCAGVKILGGYTNNLGRNDQINLFDGAGVVVDRLTYGDEAFPGSIRTQEASGWVSALGLGVDNVFEWTLSSTGDSEDSLPSNGGAIGSPGRSTRATVPFEPCGAVIDYALAVAIDGPGLGTVTGEGIACPGDCDEIFPEGTNVTLAAAPAAGFVFDGWGGDCSGTDDCPLIMDADKAVTASFISAANITVDPDSLAAGLVAGQSQTQVLTLANTGEAVLTWAITEEDACALPGWVDADPAAGSIAGGGNQPVDVTFDAAGLAPDSYEANLCVASNDPDLAIVIVPLSLNVTAVAAPVLAFAPSTLDFGDVDTGSTSASLSAILFNSGDADATDVAFTAPGSGFTADTSDCGAVVAAGSNCQVFVTFAPGQAGSVAAALAVDSTQGAVAELALQGVGVEPPDPVTDLVVGIYAQRDFVRRGQLLDYVVTVENIGPDAATGASVATTLSSALDLDFAQWMCIGPAASGCTAEGQGDLGDDGLSIPSGGGVSYLVSAPVRWDASGTVSTQAQAEDAFDLLPTNNTDEASSEIVLYRDGFEPYGDGVVATPLQSMVERLTAGEAIALTLPETHADALIETVLAAAPEDATLSAAAFRLERLNGESRSWVRLVAQEEDGSEYASQWLPANPGIPLRLSLVDEVQGGGADDASTDRVRTVRLAVGAVEVHLPLVERPASYGMWSIAPLDVTPVAGAD